MSLYYIDLYNHKLGEVVTETEYLTKEKAYAVYKVIAEDVAPNCTKDYLSMSLYRCGENGNEVVKIRYLDEDKARVLIVED